MVSESLLACQSTDSDNLWHTGQVLVLCDLGKVPYSDVIDLYDLNMSACLAGFLRDPPVDMKLQEDVAEVEISVCHI